MFITFDVNSSKEVDIFCGKMKNLGLMGTLFMNQTCNYVACGEDEGNAIKGKFVAKQGNII